MGGTAYRSSEQTGRAGQQAYLPGTGVDKQTSALACECGRKGVFSGDDKGSVAYFDQI